MRLRAVWICAFGLLLGCGSEKPSVKADDAGAPDAGKKAVDSKIAAALEATGSASSSVSAGQKPPPNGVFGPGEADLAIAPNTPPKVELLGEGREPRFGFRPSASAVLPREVTVEFVTQRAGQVSPQVSFRLAVGDGPLPAAPDASGKPAASAAPTAKPAASAVPTAKPVASAAPTATPVASAAPGGSALASGSAVATGPAAPPAGGSVLVLHVADVAVAKMQQVALPADFDKQLKLLVGTTLRLRLGPEGILAGIDVAVPQGTPEGIADFVSLLADVLGLFEVPAPDKPVGVGGYWMVSDRRLASGLPVLRYRLYRVEELKDGVAKVSVTVKQYLADGKLDIQAPPGAEVKLVRFDSEGTLSLALRPGATVAERAKAQEPFVLTLAVGGQQAQQGIETVAQLVAGGAALPTDDDDAP